MKIVFFTGAGISAESGVSTFRDEDGLWCGYRPEEVASIHMWKSQINRDQKRKNMLNFYNERRRGLSEVHPNQAHIDIGELCKDPNHEVYVITQNVDDLHERGGATNILHLHGKLLESKSSLDESLVYECLGDLNLGDKCERGSQLRPNIVMFGENVSLYKEAQRIINECDAIISVGTSGVVEPAASLFNDVDGSKKFKAIVNPKIETNMELKEFFLCRVFEENATTGVRKAIDRLLNL